MKFVDQKNDIAFKKVSEDSSKTEIIISFMNAVLELPRPITSLTIASPYQLPSRTQAAPETFSTPTSTAQTFYSYDSNGNVTDLIDSTGAAAHYEYDPYGSQTKLMRQSQLLGLVDLNGHKLGAVYILQRYSAYSGHITSSDGTSISVDWRTKRDSRALDFSDYDGMNALGIDLNWLNPFS
jgi:hypothetical protein